MTPTIQDKTKRILALYDELKMAPSLQPSLRINQLFTELVGLCARTPHTQALQILSDPRVQQIKPQLRQLCSQGEYELESFWAAKIAASNDPAATLEQFPYFDNYRKLTELEFRSLGLSGIRPIKRVLFVGSGPLPLSAMLLAQHYDLQVDNLDNDQAAVTTSTRLAGSLGLASRVRVMLADARSFDGYGRYDAIFLASLVGQDPDEKRLIIETIAAHMKPDSLLLARTAHDLRTLLYPEVELDYLGGLVPQVRVEPLNEVINSIIVLEKPSSHVPTLTPALSLAGKV